MAPNSALTAVENKIPDVSSLVKNKDYDAKILDIEYKVSNHDHDEYNTTSEFNNLSTEHFKARLAQANLVAKIDFDDKLQNLYKNVTSNKTKHLLVENELKELQKFDMGYFRGKNYFGDDETQNYLVFQPITKYLKTFTNILPYVTPWESKGFSNYVIKPPTTSIIVLLQKCLNYI